ncbi:MAG: histone deacetylase [Thermoleophilaceae bacterium]
MPPGLYFRHASSLEHDTGSHPENRNRITAIETELERRDWLGWERRDAPAVEMDQLLRVHTAEHVAHIREVAERGGGWFDADTVASRGSYDAALHAAGGACAMVDALMAKAAPAGFCGLRPPGHHCEVATPMGFCLFNNVAIAAQHALDAHGAERVAVFDWDVHHGNGTNDIFHGSRDVLYVSIHQSPLYPGTGPLRDVGSGAGEGYTVNLPVPPGAGEPIWLSLVEHVVVPAIRAFDPRLILVSAGFDGHRDDELAQCTLETGSFARMAAWVRVLAQELGVPFGAVLEGGYSLTALAASLAATLETFAGGGEPVHVDRDALTDDAAALVGAYWPVGAG